MLFAGHMPVRKGPRLQAVNQLLELGAVGRVFLALATRGLQRRRRQTQRLDALPQLLGLLRAKTLGLSSARPLAQPPWAGCVSKEHSAL